MTASPDRDASLSPPTGGMDQPDGSTEDTPEEAPEDTAQLSPPDHATQPRAPIRPSRRHVVVSLIAALAVLATFFIIDRRVPPRPRVELIDQGGLAALQPAEIDQITAQAAGLDYPVSFVFADRPGLRGDWERTVQRLAQPDRLAIGIATADRWVVVSRGAQLPLAASQEQAVRSAALGQVANGEPARGALLALVQAQAFGNPLPAKPAAAPLDTAKLRLIVSILAPLVVLIFCLGVICHRVRSRYS